MRSYLNFLFIVLLVGLSSCNNKSDNIAELLNKKGLSNEEKLALIFENNYLAPLGFTSLEVNWLKSVYKKRDNKPFFCEDTLLSAFGKINLNTINNSLAFGIPAARLKTNLTKQSSNLLQELYLCVNSARMIEDLNMGCFDFGTKKLKESKISTPEAFIKAMDEAKKISLEQLFLKQGPADTNYRYLAMNLYKFCQKYPLDTTSFVYNNNLNDSSTNRNFLVKILKSKGYLKGNIIASEQLTIGLKEFQKDNGLTSDGVINKNTITALAESTHKKLLRAAISLDKIRQSRIHQPKYLRINIAEYKLYFYSNDSLKSVNRIVVGKTSNQTPELSSKITRIVVFPFWKVPATICKNEALPAIKKNIAYLKRNHYKIYRENKVEVDPSTVDWKNMKNFPFSLIQDPGSHNSLGIIKFEFNNPYSVYVHDTPSKSLFNRAVRNLSHGCMRCESPVELARIIIQNDRIGTKYNKIISDSLDSIIEKKANRSIFLKVPIPIFVYYQTVVADRNNVIFYLDVYAKDEEYLTLLQNKTK